MRSGVVSGGHDPSRRERGPSGRQCGAAAGKHPAQGRQSAFARRDDVVLGRGTISSRLARRDVIISGANALQSLADHNEISVKIDYSRNPATLFGGEETGTSRRAKVFGLGGIVSKDDGIENLWHSINKEMSDALPSLPRSRTLGGEPRVLPGQKAHARSPRLEVRRIDPP